MYICERILTIFNKNKTFANKSLFSDLTLVIYIDTYIEKATKLKVEMIL